MSTIKTAVVEPFSFSSGYSFFLLTLNKPSNKPLLDDIYPIKLYTDATNKDRF
jgi:hypothetical protein